MAQAPYQQPRELSEREFNALLDRLIDQAPPGLNPQQFDRWLNPRLEAAVGEAENLPPKPEGSAVGRFVSGAAEMLNPIEMVKGAYQAVRHPVDTLGALYESHKEQFGKAAEAGRRGEFVEAGFRGLAGAMPLVGPLAASVGERIGEGDVAGGLGATTGLLTPFGVRPTVQAVRRATPQTRATVATRLEEGAHRRIADVMSPKTGREKGRFAAEARKVAPEVAGMIAEEGAPLTLAGLSRQVAAQLDDATAALDAAWDARLNARTFDTKPILEGLLERRRQLTSEAVVASKMKPKVTPPDPKAVEAAETAAKQLAKQEKDWLLQWFADDLREMPFQPGGPTAGQMREAFRNWRPGDPEHLKHGIGQGSARVAGTPTQGLFHALGITGSRADIAAKLERAIEGKGRSPKMDGLRDALREAFTGDFEGRAFDWSRVSDATLKRLGVTRAQFNKAAKGPMTGPNDLETPMAARMFDPFTAGGVEPVPDVPIPQGTKTGRPLGRNVIPQPAEQRVAILDRAIADIRRLGPKVRYESIRKMRQLYDPWAKLRYHPMAADPYRDLSRAKAAADITGVLRDTLATWDPATAAANKPYAVWKSASDVLEATAEAAQTQSKVGRIIAARVTSLIMGHQVAGIPGQLAGLVLAPSVEVALTTPVARLQTAKLMKQLAAAIRRQDVGRVNSLTHQIVRIGAKYGPAPSIAVSQATSPSGFQSPSTAPAQ